jgi:trimeric autotransporter adhesin
MRRFLTLVCLLVLAVPAGITISGCTRNPAGNYCNGLGYGPKVTALSYITLGPQFTGISLAFGQTRQSNAPAAFTCKNTTFSVTNYSYGTTNNLLVDVSPSGNICAGTWNRNSGGGIADYTICSAPNPLPSNNGGLPYGVAYETASADGVTSNPVPVYVHAPVTSITLDGPQQCLSQGQLAQLDSQACYSNNGKQQLLCAPSNLTSAQYACPYVGAGAPPTCESSIGTMSYAASASSVATINAETNQITAQLPGTTVITANLAGSGSTAGYFSTCPPAKISVTLNGATSGVVTQGVQQNLVTSVTDTQGNSITGLTLNYQSTNPQNVSVSSTGGITASFPGAGSVYAICQPSTCNPAPINQIGLYGTGLPISSNPVDITIPGSSSAYVWYAAPGQSQYFVPYQLLSGTPGSTVRLPYVPNSMVMDRLGSSLYFGSQTELMVYNTTSNSITGQFTGVPGVVLAVSPSNANVLVNDQKRQLFYLFNTGSSGTIQGTFGGLGVSAQWTPDSQTLYVTDSAAANALQANIDAGITNHTDTLYVYNANTGWTKSALPCSNGGPTAANPCTASNGTSNGAQSVAIMVPSVGAYFSGNPTVANTWCPSGNVGQYASMLFYPRDDSAGNMVAGDSVDVQTDQLAATVDGNHILGATHSGSLGSNGAITLTDVGVTVPSDNCLPPDASATVPGPNAALQTLSLSHTTATASVNVNATQVNQVVTSPAAVASGTTASAQSLSFITYNGNTTGATLPYYKQTSAASSSIGTVGYVSFAGSNASAITAPIAGAFSSDNTTFFVSTSGDNQVHYINTATLQDTQQITPNLPGCTPVSAGGNDPGCTLTTTTAVVPASVITVKPRAIN